jgi:uncharacterized membrane protein YbaN (DUF454 family)
MSFSNFFHRLCGAFVATALAVGFFFAIIGVFGLATSILALVLFVALAALMFRRPQTLRTGR